MCAINGFNWEDKELIEKMNRCLSHRGPDGSGTFLTTEISLGHNRLSIIDTRVIANQPMNSDDGRYIIVFNGEIYNFGDIKRELDGYIFSTNSDTEVILAAYKKWGKECVSRLNGMFAFAIWDTIEKSLFITRDPVGIKPLYYHFDGKKLIFSSEIKAILEHPLPRILNTEAFSLYMRVLYTPEPYTLFEGINKLTPGHTIFLKNNNLSINKYTPYKVNYQKEEYGNPSKLKEKIGLAVKRQLISDRPLGVYLSGGVDSTTVLNAVSNVQKNITTFSVGFELSEGEQEEKFNKDMLLARKTAQLYKTDHHEVLVKKDEVINLLEEASYIFDEPVSNPTIIPMIKLARFAKEKVTVVLGGDGGDELFGGYERYRLSLISQYYQLIPSFITKILNNFSKFNKLDTHKGVEQFMLFMFQKDKNVSRVLNEKNNSLPKEFFDKKYFSDTYKSGPELLMNVDQNSWLVDESLLRSDKTSMSAGLELRVPLLDLEIVDYAKHIPVKEKVSPNSTKKILKNAMKGILPEYILKQPKRGWFSPGAKWLRDPNVLVYVTNVLSEEYYTPTKDIFNWKEVKDMLDEHVRGDSYHFTMLWAIISFQLWAKRYNIKL